MNDAMLIFGIVSVIGLLTIWQMKDDSFDLRWLIVDNEKKTPSLFKLGQMMAMLASTWAMIYETRHGRLTEWLFLAYICVWSGVNVANKVAEKFKQKEPQE